MKEKISKTKIKKNEKKMLTNWNFPLKKQANQ